LPMFTWIMAIKTLCVTVILILFVLETRRHLIANNPSFNATFSYSVCMAKIYAQ